MKKHWLRFNNNNFNRYRTSGMVIVAVGAVLLAGCGGGGGGGNHDSAMAPPPTPIGKTIADLQTNQTLASTVAANGDKNPYGLATPPAGYNGAGNVLQSGDILISNFSDQTGMIAGKTIMRYTPSSGQMTLFYTNKVGTGPAALAIGPTGDTWIANYQLGYINLTDGASTGDGNEIVVAPNGNDLPNDVGIIDNSSGVTFDPSSAPIAGPWGIVYAVGTPFFFMTQTDSSAGFVQRQEINGALNATHLVTIGQLPTGSNAFDPTGPQGLAYDVTHDVLYVASTANNSIVAFTNASAAVASFNAGIVIYSGAPLNAPVGLAMNPTNGDLIVVNQLDNNMIEIAPNPTAVVPSGGGGGGGYSPMAMVATPQIAAAAITFSGKLIATKILDSTPVDANAGTGSALFGVLAVSSGASDLTVYYTNANTNTLNVLK